jgi:hypothetical protein
VATARLVPDRHADECQHGDRLDDFDDVTGDGSLPLHAVERIAYGARSQSGRAVHSAAVCAAPVAGKHVCADSEHATGARGIGGKGEPQRARADDARFWAEPARPAQPLPISIEFIAVLDQGRAEDVPRSGSGRHRYRAPVPGIAVIAGMTVRHPPAYVIGQTDVAVVAARWGGQIDRLPTVVVCSGVRPVSVIADMESPGAIEQSSCGAQIRRIRAAADRQIGDHDGPCHQRHHHDADDQSALCHVDRGRPAR